MYLHLQLFRCTVLNANVSSFVDKYLHAEIASSKIASHFNKEKK